MALNFPSSPTIGQVYTDSTSGFSYEWDGTVWKSYSSASSSQIKVLDDISGSFNGVTVSFPITSGGFALNVVSNASLRINLGGVIQSPGTDYSIFGTNLVFTTAPGSGLSFSGISLGPAVPVDYANNGNVYTRDTFTATSGQTVFTITGTYTVGYIDVYRNGVRLTEGTDYTATNGTTFVLTTPANLNDEVESIGYKVATLVTTLGQLDNLLVTGVSTFVGGFNLGISSAATPITSGPVTTLNFVGAGNTFLYNPGTKTVDISIAGGGGSGVSSTGVSTAAIWSNPSFITASYTLDEGNNNYGVFGPISVAVGATITVGVGNTFVIV